MEDSFFLNKRFIIFYGNHPHFEWRTGRFLWRILLFWMKDSSFWMQLPASAGRTSLQISSFLTHNPLFEIKVHQFWIQTSIIFSTRFIILNTKSHLQLSGVVTFQGVKSHRVLNGRISTLHRRIIKEFAFSMEKSSFITKHSPSRRPAKGPTKFIIFSAEFVVLNAQFLVFNTQFLGFTTKFIIFTHPYDHASAWEIHSMEQ